MVDPRFTDEHFLPRNRISHLFEEDWVCAPPQREMPKPRRPSVLMRVLPWALLGLAAYLVYDRQKRIAEVNADNAILYDAVSRLVWEKRALVSENQRLSAEKALAEIELIHERSRR